MPMSKRYVQHALIGNVAGSRSAWLSRMSRPVSLLSLTWPMICFSPFSLRARPTTDGPGSVHFQHAAEVYGRIIISERYLSIEDKTIKPLDIGTFFFLSFIHLLVTLTSCTPWKTGGVAGGDKVPSTMSSSQVV